MRGPFSSITLQGDLSYGFVALGQGIPCLLAFPRGKLKKKQKGKMGETCDVWHMLEII